MEKITFSLWQKINGVVYFLSISDTKLLRIYTPTTSSKPVFEMLLYAVTETTTVCPNAVGIMGASSVTFYVLCIKNAPSATDQYTIDVITLAATPTQARIPFAPTGSNTISIKRGLIGAASITTGGPRTILFVYNAVNMTEISATLADQPDCKYLYTVDTSFTPPKVALVTLGTIAGPTAAVWSTENAKYIMDISVMTINSTPPEQRLMVLAFTSNFVVYGFRIAITAGDVAITNWDARVSNTNTNGKVFLQFSSNLPVLYGFDADNKQTLIMDYIPGAAATDTVSSIVKTGTYQNRAGLSALGECDQIDANNRFCTFIYTETIDATSTNTVFELVQTVRPANTAKLDRLFINGMPSGYFYSPAGADIYFIELNRMEVDTYPVVGLGGDITKHKKNLLVLNANRFASKVYTELPLSNVVGSPTIASPVNKNFKWIANELLWEIAVPTNPYKISWYQNTALPVIFPMSQLKGTGLRFAITGDKMSGGVIKDNPVSFSSFGSGDQINIVDNELYLLGSWALVKAKALTANFWIYQCMNSTNVTTATVMMNCTQTFKTPSFQGSVWRYYALPSDQIVVFSAIGTTGFSITVVSNKTWASGTILETATPIVDGWAYYNPTSKMSFAVVLIQVNSKFMLRVYDLSDNGVSKKVSYDSDPAVLVLNNPAGIARVDSETNITVADIRGNNSLYYMITTKLGVSPSTKLEQNTTMSFYRDALPKTTTTGKANFCLFDNNKLLYYLTDASRVAGLSMSTDNDYEVLSLGLTDLGVTKIVRVDCNFRTGNNSFALIGNRAAGSVGIIYNVESFDMLSMRVQSVATLDNLNALDAGFSYYDGTAWYFAGYKTGTPAIPYVRVVNDSFPMIVLRSSDVGTQTATITVTNGNATITPSPSFQIVATFAAPMTSLPATPILPASTPIDANASLLLDNFIKYNGPIISAKLFAPNVSYAMDMSLITLNARIMFQRVVYTISRLRRLADTKSDKFSERRILQGGDGFYPTILKVKDGLLIAATDSPTRTRFLVVQNTEVYKRDIDLSSNQFCNTLDFRVATDSSVSMMLYCGDSTLRFLRFATDTLTPLSMEWTSAPITTSPVSGGTAMKIGSILAFCDSTYSKWFVLARDITNNAIRVYGSKVTGTASTGALPIAERTSLAGSSLFSGVDIVLNSKWYFCVVMVDGAANGLKGMCVDPSIEPLTDTLPALADIAFSGSTTGTIFNVSCSRNPKATDEFFFCDVLSFDAKIYEIKLKIQVTPSIAIVKDSETTYDRYRDAFGYNIASGPDYFAVTGKSIEESFDKIIVYKRKSAGGNQWAFYAVDGSECTGPSGNSTRTSMALYNHPVDGNPRLMVSDLFNKTIGRIYRITNWNITFNNAGFYEQQRLMNMQVNLNNESTVLNSTVPLRSILFSPDTPNKTVNDLVTKDWFWDYLVWWCIGGGTLALLGILFGLYVCRRETLKKYVGSGGQ